jgi:hypothetical protein
MQPAGEMSGGEEVDDTGPQLWADPSGKIAKWLYGPTPC